MFYWAHVPRKREWQSHALVMCTVWGEALAGNLMVSLQGWRLCSKSLWQAGVKAAVCRGARWREKKCSSAMVVVELVGGWQEAPQSTVVDAEIQSWEYEVCVWGRGGPAEGRSGRVFVESSTRKRRRRRGLVHAMRLDCWDFMIGIQHIDLAKLLILLSLNLSVEEPINISRSKLQHKTRKKQRKPLSVEMQEITVNAVAAVLLDLHRFFLHWKRNKEWFWGFSVPFKHVVKHTIWLVCFEYGRQMVCPTAY